MKKLNSKFLLRFGIVAVAALMATMGLSKWNYWSHDPNGPCWTNDSRGTVLNGKDAIASLRPCSHPGPDSYDALWQPSRRDIHYLEKALPDFLAAQQKDQRVDVKQHSFSEYHRQYAGFVEHGKRKIYVNGIETPESEWRHEYANVCDGSEGLFGAIYDVESGRLSGFDIDGHSIAM